MRYPSLFAAFLTLVLGGCATTVRTLDGEPIRVGSERFREHALAVFKRQNSTLTAIFDAFEQADDEEASRLDSAEQRMIEACESLNSAAASQRDGESLGVGVLLGISSTIRPCDEATFNADQLVREIQVAPLSETSDDEQGL